MEDITRCGYAEVDITPKKSVEIVGFDRRDTMSRGVLDALLGQVLLFEREREKYCLVTIDSLGFTVEKAMILREEVGKEIGVPPQRVMVCFSHTHSAPNAATEPEYFEQICARLREGAAQAAAALMPVKISWGCTKGEIGVNRRNPKGPVDDRIGVLKILNRATGKLEYIVLRVTAHANVLTSDNYNVSSDFIGTTRVLLEKNYACKVLITQGASGDIRPRYQHSRACFMEEHPREAELIVADARQSRALSAESMESLKKMAMAIERSVRGILLDTAAEEVKTISILSEEHEFLTDVPTMESAQTIVAEARRKASIDGSDWLEEVRRLNRGGIRSQHKKIEIQYFMINKGCLCGIANEAMCQIAIDIERETGNSLVFFGGYTNGCDGYLPTEEEYDRGGFEVLWSYLIYYRYHGRVMPLNRDTAEKIVDIVVRCVRENGLASRAWPELK